MKLKALLALTAALSFGGALAQDAPAPVAPAITDVPAGHWAKDAVDELVARRIIIGFPDGTFRGSENLTRYQAAVMIQRLLEQMAAGNATVPADMMTTLQNAVQELASDLAALGVRVADLEDNGVARDDFAALEDRVSGFDDNIGDLTSRVEALEGMTPPDAVDLTDVTDRLTALEDSQAAQDDTLTDHEDRIAALEDTVANLNIPDAVDLTDVTDRISALEDSQSAQDDTLADVDSRLGVLEESQTAQDNLIADLDSRLGTAEASLDEVRAGLDDNTAVDADLQAAIDELRDGLDATTTASDTALAQARDLQDALDALTERTDTLEGNFSDLSASVESNTSSITALNDLTVLLNQDILDLQDQVAAILAGIEDTNAANAAQFDAVNGSIADLSSSVDQRFDDFQADVDSRFDSVYTELDGLRAFDDVIRRDVDVLTGRVTVNETQIGDLNNKVTGIDTRLTTLENNVGFTIGGSLTFNYYQSGLNGRDFDIDRIIPGTKFSTGSSVNGDGNANGSAPADYADLGRPSVTGTTDAPSDLDQLYGFARGPKDGARSVEGKATVSLAFQVNFKNKALSGNSADVNKLASANDGFNVQQVSGEFGLANFDTSNGITGDGTYNLGNLSFYVKNVSTNFTVGGAPVTLNFGLSPKVQLSDYVFDNNKTSRGPGIVATIDGSTVAGIGGLAPKITAVYGSKNGADADFGYFAGARAEITVAGLNAGLNFAREGGDGISPVGQAFNATNGQTTVYGADLKGTNVLGTGFGVRSEYAMSSSTLAGSTGQSAFYVKLNGALGPITLEDLNYRTISAGYDKKAAISEADPADGDNGSSAPYSKNQTGFGVAANVSLAGFKVRGYYDMKTDYNNITGANNDDVTKYGVSASGSLGPVTVGAYYDAKSDLGTAAQKPNSGTKVGGNASVGTIAGFTVSASTDLVTIDGQTVDVDGQKYLSDPGVSTNFKVGIAHNGASADALIKGLNLDASYTAADANYSKTTLTAGGDYTLATGGFTFKPSARYTAVADSDGVSGFDGVNAASPTDTYTRVAAGLIASTPVLDLPLKPSLEGRVNYYNTAHTNAAASVNGTTPGNFTASELGFQVTARLNEFLFPKSSFAASYGAYNGVNRFYRGFLNKDNTGQFQDRNLANSNAPVNLSGYYLEWNLLDVNVSFGDFTLSGTQGGVAETNRAQAFRINYKLSF